MGFFCPTHVTAGAIPRMPCSATEMLVDVSEGFSTDLLRGSLSVCSVSRRLQYDFISACISVYIRTHNHNYDDTGTPIINSHIEKKKLIESLKHS